MYFTKLEGLKGKERALAQVADQRRWIEHCEKGCSYDGPNGPKIRKADEDALRRFESELERLRCLKSRGSRSVTTRR